MKKINHLLNKKRSLFHATGTMLLKYTLSLLVLMLSTSVAAQNTKMVSGVVFDSSHSPIPGASVLLKNSLGIGVITDINGEFELEIPKGNQVLQISFLGMEPQEIDVTNTSEITVILKDQTNQLKEMVVVGYGQQRRESVVGAISQTKGEVLERAGGVSSLGAALTGNVPGVITSASTGLPGEEDPQIVIRGNSTWNNSSPLILVDGVERPMNSVDISSVESVSVLKDASATAVFGVRGANGVILITTKRGKEGRADIRVGVNSTMKVPSKLPGKYDSYNALKVRNEVIEYELGTSPVSWNDYLPQTILDKYRNPANLEEAERYPNIDWDDTLFKEFAMSYNANINVSGGTKFVKYFASADFLHEGDLFREFDNNRGYLAGYGFNRLNVRSNLDFQLTPITKFRVNLSGSRGEKQRPWGADGSDYSYWIAAYSTAPDVFIPQYSDGTWGYYAPDEQKGLNSQRILAISGVEYTTTSRVTTDFTLDQDLSMLLKGLSVKGSLSLDNTFVEGSRGINDLYNDAQSKWIDPETGAPTYKIAFDGTSRFDIQDEVNWTTSDGSVQDWATYRRVFYQLQLNYVKTFADKHHVTAMGLFNRNEEATGSQIPSYREDWVFRTTYNYAGKYFLDYSGAYNGSEKFSPEYRFAFFSSGGLGWMLSEEKFMENVNFLDMFKIRGSYGEIGDDNVYDRWLYLTQWSYGGEARMGVTGVDPEYSPYTWYKESALGNPNVHWEVVKKSNLGADFSVWNGLVAGSFDYFKDVRSDILIRGDNRAIPSYFGTSAPVANLGKVEVNGYEIDLRFNKNIRSDMRIWANINVTHAKNKILEADSPSLLPGYQQSEGMPIGQYYSYVSSGYYNTWDELYASTMHDTNDDQKLPGNYNILDYNGDGVINSDDNIPYGYSGTPENSYNATIGYEWKGLSAFVQFYGVNNVTRQVVFNSLGSQNHLVYEEGTYWSKDNTGADVPMPRWLSTPSGYNSGNRYMFDGSYVRLKNAEIAYTFNRRNAWVNKAGLQNVRLYLNGNNLWVYTKMPDDRESNFAGTGWASQGAYPTVKRFNLGVNVTF